MTERELLLRQLAATLCQVPHDPAHHFGVPVVLVSPRRVLDVLDVPGGASSDFEGAVA